MPQRIKDPRTGKLKNLYSRAEIGLPPSRAPRGRELRDQWIVHHGVGKGQDLSLAATMAVIRGYYRYHVHNRGWSDIGYSFLFADATDVGGAVFEGRGWGMNGGHTQNGGNVTGYACCYVGDGRYTAGSVGAWEAHRALLQHGVDTKRVMKSHRVSGHDDWWQKECPGHMIKAIITKALDLGSIVVGRKKDELMLKGDTGPEVQEMREMINAFLLATGNKPGSDMLLNENVATYDEAMVQAMRHVLGRMQRHQFHQLGGKFSLGKFANPERITMAQAGLMGAIIAERELP